MKKLIIFLTIMFICSSVYAAALTAQQIYNINVQRDISNSIWQIKAAAKAIQYEQMIVNTNIDQLRAQGLKVNPINWSDINTVGIPNWAVIGYGN